MLKYKIRATFTIDPDLFDKFIELINELGISHSKVVSIYIKNGLMKIITVRRNCDEVILFNK